MANGSAFSLAFDYRYRLNDEIFNGSNKIGNPNDISTEFHQFSLSGSYRLDENWIFNVRVPFTDGTRREDGQSDVNISGPGRYEPDRDLVTVVQR